VGCRGRKGRAARDACKEGGCLKDSRWPAIVEHRQLLLLLFQQCCGIALVICNSAHLRKRTAMLPTAWASGFWVRREEDKPSSPCHTLSFFSKLYFLPSLLKAQSLRPVVLSAGPYYRVVHQVLGDKVETPIHDSIRELITWECKEHGVNIMNVLPNPKGSVGRWILNFWRLQ
jgi:hypothetical protein